jgi:glycosyltransferase involved in cell wall biosynthesis
VATVVDPDPARPLDLCFLIGSLDISGGTYVILQHALEASRRGDRVVLAPLFPPTEETTDWHPALTELPIVGLDELTDRAFDVVVATWWRTVYELHRVRARRHVYFVQSVESRFYAPTEPRFAGLAAATYDLPLSIVTISPWIQAYLAIEHRRPAFLAPNGIDKRRFTPLGPRFAPRDDDRLRVLVEGPIDVAMKQVPETIEAVRDSKADEVWLLTSSAIDDYPGVDRVFSRVPIDVTPGVYRSCDVLVKLSRVEGMFGPPLEMMHCGGTAVVWDVTGHEDYIVNDDNAVVTPTGDYEAVVAALDDLAVDRHRTRALSSGALRTAAAWPSWAESSATFHRWLRLLARHDQPDDELAELTETSARRAQELR